MLVGRERQRAAIDDAIAGAIRGHSAVLAFSGAPGIGKSALLRYAAERAGAMTQLRARGIESETQIPFASLLELLRPVLPLIERLAPPQLAALERAFALRGGGVEDRFAIGAATLGLLAAAAEDRPLLVLLDDVQWFDGPSSEALRFALRRLEADPIAVILAHREHHRSLLDGSGISTLTLEGLSEQDLRRLRPELPGEAAVRLLEMTGGNPLALLELTPDIDELPLMPAGAPLLLSARISASYLRRAATLDEDARRCLLLAATSESGDLQLLGEAAQRLGLNVDALLAAEEVDLITIVAGEVEFQHPLVRSAVYSDAPLGARREAHRVLAAVLPEHELDRRAWHLAAAAAGTDEDASASLEQAALRSLERSAYATAASAFERAARLTGQRARRAALLVRAAEAAWNAGHAEQALRLLEESRATGDRDPATEVAHDWLAGRIALTRGPVMRGHMILTATARLATTDLHAADAAITMLADAALACFLACAVPELTAVAEQAVAILPPDATPAARLRVASIVGAARTISGDAAAGARSFHEAEAIAETTPQLLDDTSLLPWLALGPLFLREAKGGRARLEAVLSATRERAAVGALPLVLDICARDRTASEQWRLGEATYREAVALSRESDQRVCLAMALAGLAWLQARQGRESECRDNAAEALALATELGSQLHALWSHTALGELELGLGRPAQALEHFERQRQLAASYSISDVDLWPGPEMVESCLRLGRDEEASALAAAHHEAARAKGQPWSLARALRCQGLVASRERFAELFESALALHRQTPDVFELACSQLAYGERLRRARNRVLARARLREAERIFAALGALPWAQRAQAELEATGETLRRGEPNTVAELTPQELQIATMLASGRTTRETGAALFLSPKTVEYHLRHVYLKLGIHSREELARVDGLLQDADTENTGGSRVAAVHQLAPASPEPKTSPDVAPK